jgi:hypothetical protein
MQIHICQLKSLKDITSIVADLEAHWCCSIKVRYLSTISSFKEGGAKSNKTSGSLSCEFHLNDDKLNSHQIPIYFVSSLSQSTSWAALSGRHEVSIRLLSNPKNVDKNADPKDN